MNTKKPPKTGTTQPTSTETALQNKTILPNACVSLKGLTILFVGTLIFYFPLLFGHGYLWNDFVELYFPYRLFAALSLKEMVFPFWNPYVFSGMPFFADIQTAVLYPFNLILTLFASTSDEWLNPLVLQIQVVLHIFIAGSGMCLVCRDYGLRRGPAMIAAVTLMFSAFFTTHIFHINLIHSASWLPLIFLLFRRMVRSLQLKHCALGAFLLTLAVLAGHPQMILYTCYWLGAYYVFFLLKQVISGSCLREEIHRFSLVILFVALSAGMASIQLLPTNELATLSARPFLSYEASCEGSLRPFRWITFLSPDFFGSPGNAFWGISEKDLNPGVHYYWETAVYCGFLPLVLAAIALGCVRKPIVHFFGITLFLAFLLTLGDSFFLYKLFHAYLPGFDRFRIPSRMVLFLTISIAMLSAFGFQYLMDSVASDNKQAFHKIERTLFMVAGVLVLFYVLFSIGFFKKTIVDFLAKSGAWGENRESIQAIVADSVYPLCLQSLSKALLFLLASLAVIVIHTRGWLKPAIGQWLCLSVLFCDLLFFGYGYASSSVSVGQVYQKTPLVKTFQLESKAEFFRMNSRTSRPGTTDLGGNRMLFLRNQGSVHRLFLIEGFNPLRLKRQFSDRRERTLDLLNVKYTVHVNPKNNRMHFITNDDYLPRAWMAYDYVVEKEETRIDDILHDPSFDYRRSIILEETPTLPIQPQDLSIRWHATITYYDLNTITVEVETSEQGFLVLSEIFYPAWHAYVDDRPEKLYRANYALRAIPVPKGKHVVTCHYESLAFRIGLTLALVSLIFTAGLLLFAYRSSRTCFIGLGRTNNKK